MKFFVTDPCLVVSNDDWDAFNEKLDWAFGAELPEPFVVPGVGKVLEVMSTANGDGGCKVGKHSFGTDTGTLSITEVSDDFVPAPSLWSAGAVVDSLDKAKELMTTACSKI